MADKSATWNPVTGCSHVSPGCEWCYAERVSHRFGHTKLPWGAQHAAENVVLHYDRLNQPLRWKRPRRIFVNSMSDLFHDQVPDEFIVRVFRVMAQAHWHTFQILTKRPERMAHLLGTEAITGNAYGRWFQSCVLEEEEQHLWPLPNVWLGVSAEDQERADERIPRLLQTPAAVRFVSLEPLLGPINIAMSLTTEACPHLCTWPRCECATDGDNFGFEPGVDWVIVGGESGGPGYRRLVRPCEGRSITHWARDESSAHETFNARCWDAEDAVGASPYCEICDFTGWRPDEIGSYWEGGDALAAVRSLRDQCVAAGVPFFFKQWGGPTPKAGGRLLDGRTWDEYPVAH